MTLKSGASQTLRFCVSIVLVQGAASNVRRGLNTVDFGRFKNRDLGGAEREGSRFSGRGDQASGMWSLAL
jgi:hypothetical protein